jgi:hypothetical protein
VQRHVEDHRHVVTSKWTTTLMTMFNPVVGRHSVNKAAGLVSISFSANVSVDILSLMP